MDCANPHSKFCLSSIHPAETFPLINAIGIFIQGMVFAAVQGEGLQALFAKGCSTIAQYMWPGTSNEGTARNKANKDSDFYCSISSSSFRSRVHPAILPSSPIPSPWKIQRYDLLRNCGLNVDSHLDSFTHISGTRYMFCVPSLVRLKLREVGIRTVVCCRRIYDLQCYRDLHTTLVYKLD